MKKLKWWTMAVLVFVAMFGLLIDIFIYMYDPQMTISATIQDFVGGSEGSYQAALLGFIVGSLLTHFTKWGRDD